MSVVHNHECHTRERGLKAALAITSVFLVLEFVGGLLTNSLALLADAGHMLTDVAALGLSLFAVWCSSRPANQVKTYGYLRVEILMALLNGVILVLIALFIFYEAHQRLWTPPQVKSLPMLIIACMGFLANAASASILSKWHRENLNIEAAFRHIMADILGNLGAMVAGVIMLVWQWYPADSLMSIFVGLLILFSAWKLLKDAVDILLESTPAHIDIMAVKETLRRVEGVESVHDLHVWTLTSGIHAMSCHAVVYGSTNRHDILEAMSRLCREKFSVEHTTIQLEEENLQAQEMKTCH
jgi:cobalt-zinc-cadmium efflux system protein